MANGTPTNVPLGLKEYIQGREFTIGLTGFTFEADRASVNVISALNLYSLANNTWLTIGATDVCLTPGGFGGEYILAQAIDMDFNGYGDHTYTIAGAYGDEETVKNEASYIEIDCDGIKSLAAVSYTHLDVYKRQILYFKAPTADAFDLERCV